MSGRGYVLPSFVWLVVWRLASRAAALSAADYLSEERFPGLHVLEPQASDLLIYRDGEQLVGEARPVKIEGAADWATMATARAALEEALTIPPPEPLQKPWALFDSQGRRLETVQELFKLPVAFLILLGEWMWPAVRVGFTQDAEGVLGGAPLMLRTLSLRPVVFEVEGFILPHETEEVIRIGHGAKMYNSEGVLVSTDKASKRPHNDYRTSTQTWLGRRSSKVVADLDDRTANLTRIPATHNEEVQLLRYGEGQFYSAHLDWTYLPLYNGQEDQWRRVHYGWDDRVATLFWYLNDVKEGGQTVFPKHGQPICPDYKDRCPGSSSPDPKRCDMGLRVAPKRGMVILWYNYHPNGMGDQNALHGGCPPAKGLTKWSGNKWIHTKPLGPPAKWMPDHPALKRFGWREGIFGKEDLGDPNACAFSIRNRFSSELELLWVSERTGQQQHMLTVNPGSSQSMNSFKGHTFVAKAGGRTSTPLVCAGPRSSYIVGENLEVLPGDSSEL